MASTSSIPCFSCCGAPLPPPTRCNCPENYAIPSTLYVTVLSEENWPCMNGLTFKMQYFAPENPPPMWNQFNGQFSYWRYTPEDKSMAFPLLWDDPQFVLKGKPLYYREIEECGNLLFPGALFTPNAGKCNWNAPDEDCYRKLRISFLLRVGSDSSSNPNCFMSLFISFWIASNFEPYCTPIQATIPYLESTYTSIPVTTGEGSYFNCPINVLLRNRWNICENFSSGVQANVGATGVGETVFLITE